MTKRASIMMAVAALIAVVGMSAGAAAFTTRDMLGRDVTLAAPPTRIVSLVPSVTEILYALNAEGVLVGVTNLCDFPPEARRKPKVGGMVAPSLETIVSLKPDLVVATTEGSREDAVAQLRRLNVPVYLVVAHRVADVTALGYCQLLVLLARDFRRLLDADSRLAERIGGVAKERLGTSIQPAK